MYILVKMTRNTKRWGWLGMLGSVSTVGIVAGYTRGETENWRNLVYDKKD